MAVSFSLSSVGPWLKEHWWQSAAGAGVVVGALVLWGLSGDDVRIVGDPTTKIDAIDALADKKSSGAVEAIAAAVQDPSPRVRERAVSALVKLRARPDLVRAAIGDSDQCVRIAGIEGIGDMGGPEALPVLTKIIIDEKIDVSERIACVVGIRRVGTTEAADQLAKAMDVPDPEVARTAMKFLTSMHGMKWWNSQPDPANRDEWARKKAILLKVKYIPQPNIVGGG